MYKTRIRPAVEMNAPVMFAMMNAEQSEKLERQQVNALRCIFGYGISAQKMRERAGVELLLVRRRAMAENFARKTVKSDRFKDWYPLREGIGNERRRGTDHRKFKEEYARTDRRRNSPLFVLRRLANSLEL